MEEGDGKMHSLGAFIVGRMCLRPSTLDVLALACVWVLANPSGVRSPGAAAPCHAAPHVD